MTEEVKFNPYAMAHQYAEYLGVKIGENESQDSFKSRVAGILRQKGSIIEAHEVYSGRRFDDPDQGPTGPMTGILGAVAQALQDKNYSPNDPERQIGDDIASGVIVKAPEDPTKALLKSIFDLLGPEAGMDLLTGGKK